MLDGTVAAVEDDKAPGVRHVLVGCPIIDPFGDRGDVQRIGIDPACFLVAVLRLDDAHAIGVALVDDLGVGHQLGHEGIIAGPVDIVPHPLRPDVQHVQQEKASDQNVVCDLPAQPVDDRRQHAVGMPIEGLCLDGGMRVIERNANEISRRDAQLRPIGAQSAPQHVEGAQIGPQTGRHRAPTAAGNDVGQRRKRPVAREKIGIPENEVGRCRLGAAGADPAKKSIGQGHRINVLRPRIEEGFEDVVDHDEGEISNGPQSFDCGKIIEHRDVGAARQDDDGQLMLLGIFRQVVVGEQRWQA